MKKTRFFNTLTAKESLFKRHGYVFKKFSVVNGVGSFILRGALYRTNKFSTDLEALAGLFVIAFQLMKETEEKKRIT